MNESITIRQAGADESATVANILQEAADWLTHSSMTLWRDSELEAERIAADVGAGLFFVAEKCGEAAGTVKFQLEDTFFWPDFPNRMRLMSIGWRCAEDMPARGCPRRF